MNTNQRGWEKDKKPREHKSFIHLKRLILNGIKVDQTKSNRLKISRCILIILQRKIWRIKMPCKMHPTMESAMRNAIMKKLRKSSNPLDWYGRLIQPASGSEKASNRFVTSQRSHSRIK